VKLLIDECLSPDLAIHAWEAGWHCAHVARMGLRSAQDWQLVRFAIDHDWVIVTHNSVHFKELVGRTTVHPGLVCFNVKHGTMSVEVQKRLFQLALTRLQESDPVNEVLEISLDANSVVRVETYVWPRR
jgi:predicted nuclease of predicted toxin-antitoxin system